MFHFLRDLVLPDRIKSSISSSNESYNVYSQSPLTKFMKGNPESNFALYSDNDWMETLNDQPLNKLSKNSFDNTTFMFTTLIGYCALRALGYPPTLVKTYMQSSLSPMEKNSITVARDIVAKEGFRALFKGLPLSLISTVTRQSYFVIYEHIRAHEDTDKFIRNVVGEEYIYLVKDSVAAFLASTAFQIIGNPIDVVVQRMMVQVRSDINPSAVNVSSTIKHPPPTNPALRWLVNKFSSVALIHDLVRTEGIQIFYRGFVSSAILFSLSSAIWWGTFGYIIDQLSPHFNTNGQSNSNNLSILERPLSTPVQHMFHNHSWTAQHIAAGLSSTLSVILTQPIDVCRTRLMVQSKAGDGLTAMSVCRELVRSNGFSALLTGMMPRIVSVVPTSVMTMAVYQYCKLIAVEIKIHKTKSL